MATNPNAEDAKLEELRKRYGDAVRVNVKGSTFYFRCPTLDEWEDAQQRERKGAPVGALNRELVQTCLVEGDLEALKKAFERRPGIAGVISNELGELATSDIEITVKKG